MASVLHQGSFYAVPRVGHRTSGAGTLPAEPIGALARCRYPLPLTPALCMLAQKSPVDMNHRYAPCPHLLPHSHQAVIAVRTREETQSLLAWVLSPGLSRGCSCGTGLDCGSDPEPLPPAVNKWKKQCLVPLLAIPTCIGFGIHQDRYR